jgi:hypothetical protein
MPHASIPLVLTAGVCLSGAFAPAAAEAQDASPCEELTNPVYLKVGATQQPLMKGLGRALRDDAEPLTLVYVTSGSCVNTEYVYGDKPIDNPTAFYVPSSEEQPDWDTSMPALTCTVPASGLSIDIGNSATYVSSCGDDFAEPPPGIRAFSGPIQGYGFVVPETSPARAITAEEAYFVYGFGNEGQVSPWDDEQFVFRLPPSLSTLTVMAGAAGIYPYNKAARGQLMMNPNALLDALLQSARPEKTLGIVGLELYDQDRDRLKLLAFRAFEQEFAYFPDSSATSFDKKNLRDGHYSPWAPTVWLTKVDTSGEPVSSRARRLIDLILSRPSSPAPSFEPLELIIGVGLVPLCAMQVTREPYESDPLIAYDPEEPCGCFYESVVAQTTPSGCVPCVSDSPCEEGECSHGFCEVRINFCENN